MPQEQWLHNRRTDKWGETLLEATLRQRKPRRCQEGHRPSKCNVIGTCSDYSTNEASRGRHRPLKSQAIGVACAEGYMEYERRSREMNRIKWTRTWRSVSLGHSTRKQQQWIQSNKKPALVRDCHVPPEAIVVRCEPGESWTIPIVVRCDRLHVA